MNSREKKLSGLVLLAALAACVDWVWSNWTPSEAAPAAASPETAPAEARQVVGEVNAAISGMGGVRNDVMMLALSERKIRNDPLASPPDSESDAAAADKGLACSGFIEMKGLRLALIGGLEYAQGDAVESTGEIVRSISPERVELENPSNGNVRALECRSPE